MIGLGGADCCEPLPADGGVLGVPAHAVTMVASITAPATPDSLRILLVGINVLMYDCIQLGRVHNWLSNVPSAVTFS